MPVPDPLTVGVKAKSGKPRLVDGHGRTLYAFSLDKAGKPACNGACAQAWWPVRSLGGKPQPGAGVNAPKVGNFQRADGSGQVTFRGHPLYYSIKDRHPGDRKGEQSSEFGGTWTAVPPTAAARANGSR
jgi:predicted lipoprotein with Yx(FWY)xxD motif